MELSKTVQTWVDQFVDPDDFGVRGEHSSLGKGRYDGKSGSLFMRKQVGVGLVHKHF